MKRLKFLAAMAGLAMVAAPLQAQANPGFETGDLTGWSNPCSFTGVAGGSTAHSGNFGLFSGPVGAPCTVSQSIPTVIGASYSISFWLASDGGLANSFLAQFGGVAGTAFSNTPAFSYTLQSFTATATAASTVLAFSFQDDPGFWTLDDVSVGVVAPEPSTLLLLGSGLLVTVGVAALRRKA